MEVHLFEIASQKTSNPRELADIEELRRCAIEVAEVERAQPIGRDGQQTSPARAQEHAEDEQANRCAFILQSGSCRRADSASEAIRSIVGFERDQLDFLHLWSDLAGQEEQAGLQSLIRSKEELVDGMQLFVETWK